MISDAEQPRPPDGVPHWELVNELKAMCNILASKSLTSAEARDLAEARAVIARAERRS